MVYDVNKIPSFRDPKSFSETESFSSFISRYETSFRKSASV